MLSCDYKVSKTYRKEMTDMMKEKKEVVKKLIEALPKMSTYELGYLLGRVEEKEDAAEKKKEELPVA